VGAMLLIIKERFLLQLEVLRARTQEEELNIPPI
jgi:hypothetical protein